MEKKDIPAKGTAVSREDIRLNRQFVDEDADPELERGKGEPVTPADLKGKTVDGDPEDERDQPIDQLKPPVS